MTNSQNENLGKIHELVIDAKPGRLAYAVLSFGGFMGTGDKLFAMPWGAGIHTYNGYEPYWKS